VGILFFRDQGGVEGPERRGKRTGVGKSGDDPTLLREDHPITMTLLSLKNEGRSRGKCEGGLTEKRRPTSVGERLFLKTETLEVPVDRDLQKGSWGKKNLVAGSFLSGLY